MEIYHDHPRPATRQARWGRKVIKVAFFIVWVCFASLGMRLIQYAEHCEAIWSIVLGIIGLFLITFGYGMLQKVRQ